MGFNGTRSNTLTLSSPSAFFMTKYKYQAPNLICLYHLYATCP